MFSSQYLMLYAHWQSATASSLPFDMDFKLVFHGFVKDALYIFKKRE